MTQKKRKGAIAYMRQAITPPAFKDAKLKQNKILPQNFGLKSSCPCLLILNKVIKNINKMFKVFYLAKLSLPR